MSKRYPSDIERAACHIVDGLFRDYRITAVKLDRTLGLVTITNEDGEVVRELSLLDAIERSKRSV